MKDYSLETVSDETLSDYLNFDSQENTRRNIVESLKNGSLRYEQMYVLWAAKKLEAIFILGSSPVIIPKIKMNIENRSLEFLSNGIYQLVKDDPKILILDSNFAPLRPSPFLKSGWKIKSHDELYKTDLSENTRNFDQLVLERRSSDLLAPELLQLYDQIIAVDNELGDTGGSDPQTALADNAADEDVRLFVMVNEDTVVAAATLFPMDASTVGIHLLGVLPALRKQGLGQRLHAHLFAVARATAQFHVGGTKASNLGMHRIYEKNGAIMTAEQYQLRPV